MFKSLRSKILLVVAGIVFLTTITITFFVQRETQKAISAIQDENALNLLHTVVLNVENEYKSLLFHKDSVLERRKSELKNITTLAIVNIDKFYQLYKKGKISQKEAKLRAIEEIKHMRYDQGVGYLWINDTGRPIPRMIMHPTIPDLDGEILDDPKFNCAEGIGKNLFVAFVDVCLRSGEGYVDYLWPKPTREGLTADQPKISYVQLFKEWNWIVGTGVYIDDIEVEAQKRLDAIIAELRQAFSQVKVAQTGYMFIFSGSKRILIHPTLAGTDGSKLINPVTKKPILDELIDSSRTPDIPFKYMWDKPDHQGDYIFWKRAYTVYYEPLDWYISVSYYHDEINMPAKLFRTKVFYLSGIFLLVAFVVSLLFSKSLTNPISEVVRASSSIASGNFDVSLSRSPIREIDSLTVSLVDMGNKLKNLTENLTEEKEQLRRSEEHFRLFFENLHNAINNKDYSLRVAPKSDEDILAISMNKILSALDHSVIEANNQDWLKTGQTELSNRISGEQQITDLCRNAVTYIAKHVGAQIGTIYVRDYERNDFYLIGSFAYKERKEIANRFAFGEGLVGQAALEKERILFTDVPDDYIRIESSIGNTIPKNILVVPLIYEGDVKGVIELGSTFEFSALHIMFTELISDIVAVAINATISREQLKQLFNRTTEQAEELRTQQEELQNANQDLEQQTEILRESEAKLQVQQEELQTSNEELEEKTEMLEKQKEEIEKKNRILQDKQKEIEEKARMLELATKYKSEFLANMSHELRTPLNSMLILARMLSDNEEKNLTDDQIDSAASIHRSGQNLLHLINDILDLSKIEAKKMELSVTSMKIRTLITNIEMEFKHLAKDKKLEFRVDVKKGVPASIITDSHRLQQIIRNLLGNAIKFTEKGSVKVEIAKASPDVMINRKDVDPNKLIAFSIIDTGPGIPDEKQKLIFESFTQVDGSISRRYGGTGLGLSISKELAFLLKGELQLSSTSESGTVFTLFIPEELDIENKKTKTLSQAELSTYQATEVPIDEDEPPIMETIQKEAHFSGTKTMLIIEDDSEFAGILSSFFQKNGYESIIASDGETGIKYVMEHRPTAIILDIKLPGIDGWAVLNELKVNSLTRHIPVHIISAHDYASEGLNKGAIGYLVKPVSLEDLTKAFSKIESVIDSKVKELLIIEDDKELRDGVLALMKANDINATSVGTGADALSMLTSKKFDCMILDLGLPDITGFELLDKVEADPAIDKIPVIVYTGQELTIEQTEKLEEYSASIVLKSAVSPERLLDETALFMHRVESQMPEDQQKMIGKIRNRESILAGKKVLIVDDDMRNAFALNKFLKGKGMYVSIANNGEKALDLLAKESIPDIILMDIMMPVMDGYETIREIRAQKKFETIPIIALTAKAMETDREECIKSGANDYLSKPVDVSKMLSMIRIWLYCGKE